MKMQSPSKGIRIKWNSLINRDKSPLLGFAVALALGTVPLSSYAANLVSKPLNQTHIVTANASKSSQTQPDPAKVPRQIIVKLKATAAIGSQAASVSSLSLQSVAPGLQVLMQKHGISKSEALTKRGAGQAAGVAAQAAFSQPAANGLDRIYLLTLQSDDVEKVAKEFAQDPSVEYAEPNRVASAQMLPNDPYYSSSGSFDQVGYDDLWGLKNMAPETAWDTTQGAGITVAVVDTGVEIGHEDLAANIWKNAGEIAGNGIDDDNNGYVDDVNGYDFMGANISSPAPDSDPGDANGHGTHVAGIIAAVGNNAKGVIGVAPKAKILPVRVLDNDGFGTNFQIAQGIIYAANRGARVINISLGGAGASSAEHDAIAYAHSLGAVVVAAAANSSADANFFTPANDENVITVGAIKPQLTLAGYSNFGPKIDVVAPGSEILSTLAAGSKIEAEYLEFAPEKIVEQKYVVLSGTSMAAPMVAGTVALMLAKNPALLPEEVRYRLRKNAIDMGSANWDIKYGAGRVNASASVLDTSVASRARAFIRTPFVGAAAPGNTWVGNQPLVISGLAAGNNFAGYEVAYAPASDDAIGSFTTLASGATAVDGTLATLNPAGLTDGNYIVRLTAKDANGTAINSYSNIIKDTSVRAGWPSFADYWYGFSGLTGQRPEAQALSFADLDGDGFKEVISARGQSLFAWRRDGSRFSGFPFDTDRDISSPLAIADLDGDGKQEIIAMGFSSFESPVNVIDFNGTVKSGFPAGQPGTSPHALPNYLGTTAAPAIADLDGDGKKEIIFTAMTKWTNQTNYVFLNVIDYRGQQKAGWPKSWPVYQDWMETPKATVADLDGDGKSEVLVTYMDSNIKWHLAVYSAAGAVTKDVIIEAATGLIPPSVAVADMNNDGAVEVFVGSNVGAYLYDKNITLLPGWPKSLPDGGVFASSYNISMIDVEGNGDLEAIYLSRPNDFTGGNAFVSPQVLHAYKINGTEAVGYPSQFDPIIFPQDSNTAVYNSVNNQPIAAPLVKATGNSIFVNSFFRSFIGRSGTGAELAGWPKAIPVSQSAPAIGDLDNDGILEIGTFSNDGLVYIFNETPVSNAVLSWPTLNANNARTNSIASPKYLKTYPQVYVRGTNNAWVGTGMTLIADNLWQLDANFGSTTTERFKFDIYNNWATNFGENNAGCSSNCIAEQTGADIKISQGAGSYRIRFNDKTKAYSVIKQGVNIAPVANAGPDQTVNLVAGKATVIFDGTASRDSDGSIVSYQWSNGLSGAKPAYTFTAAGTFSIILTVTDDKGATGTDTVVIKVQSSNQAPTAKTGPNQTVQGAALVTLDGTPSTDPENGPLTYGWTQTGGPFVVVQNYNQAKATVQLPAYPGTDTTYLFALTVYDNGGLGSTVETKVVQTAEGFAKVYPQVYFRGTPNNWLANTKMTLVGNNLWEISPTFGSASNERFKFDINGDWTLGFGDSNKDGIADQGGADIAITQGAGVYKIQFNDSSKRYTVVKQGVNQAPKANAGPDQTLTLVNGSVTANFNGSASTDTDGTIVSYSWNSSGWASPLTGVTPSKTFTAAGTYTVTLTTTDDKGAKGTDDVIITVKGPNQAPVARAGNDQTVSGAAAVILDGSASFDADGTIASYQWVQTSGPAVTIQNATQAKAQVTLPAYPGIPTTFTFKLTVADNLGLSSSSTTNVQQIAGNFQSTYTQVYFRGTPNNWLADRQMTLVANNTWQIDITFAGAASDRFKFDIFGNWATNFGDSNKDGVADSGGADIYVTLAGNYRIRFNDQTKAYTVTKL